LCVLDRASFWYLNKDRPTWWYLVYYVNLLLNMFRMLVHPSSGACDYFVRYCVGCIVLAEPLLPVVVQPAPGYHITNRQSRYITPTRLKSPQYSLHNNAPSSRKLLKMDVLTSETFWAVNWDIKASYIKLVYLYSHINKLIVFSQYQFSLLIFPRVCIPKTMEARNTQNTRLASRLLSKNLKIKIYRSIILNIVLYGCETWSLKMAIIKGRNR